LLCAKARTGRTSKISTMLNLSILNSFGCSTSSYRKRFEACQE